MVKENSFKPRPLKPKRSKIKDAKRHVIDESMKMSSIVQDSQSNKSNRVDSVDMRKFNHMLDLSK